MKQSVTSEALACLELASDIFAIFKDSLTGLEDEAGSPVTANMLVDRFNNISALFRHEVEAERAALYSGNIAAAVKEFDAGCVNAGPYHDKLFGTKTDPVQCPACTRYFIERLKEKLKQA